MKVHITYFSQVVSAETAIIRRNISKLNPLQPQHRALVIKMQVDENCTTAKCVKINEILQDIYQFVKFLCLFILPFIFSLLFTNCEVILY